MAPGSLRAALVVTWVVLAVTWAATIAGCDDQVAVRAGRPLSIALTEYRIVPASAQVAHGQLTILASNFGRLTHDLVISRNGRTVLHSRPLWPGQSARLTVVLSRGKYLMASSLESDQALGAYGTLVVR